ncbi:hypothetical protein [Priestia megaterium]|uniref:hypothetical protein n=1 Tax=Priestia megaterium TaxID=1404 RepID=UPI00112A04DD|nr:hypothetical protein [Priestia megaterium]TPF17987.1 hypothetical protein CBE78_01815 [Priestia megaterium]TPF22095.1 hypothetical protein CBE79_04320 [Priestia megaterium]
MSRWRNKVEVKRYLLDDLSDLEVKIVAEKLLPQLKVIYKEESNTLKRTPLKAVSYQLISDLEDVISNLEWIADSIKNKENTDDCNFSKWSEALDSELQMLKELGGKFTKYEQTFADNQRFLCIV